MKPAYLLSKIFAPEELKELEERVILILGLRLFEEISKKLSSEEKDIFNRHLAEGKIEDAIALTKNKKFDFKSLIGVIQEDLSGRMAQVVNKTIDDYKNTK